MSGCLIVDSDDEFVAVPTKKCNMAFCENRHSNNGFFCDACIEKDKIAVQKYLEQKEKYIQYKESQKGCVGFGKYKYKTVEWLIEHDKGYCRWLIKQNALKIKFDGEGYMNKPAQVAREIAIYFDEKGIEYSLM